MRKALFLILSLALAACGGDPGGSGFDDPEPTPAPIDPDTLCNTPGASRCDGFDFQVCVEGAWFRQESCQAPTPMCDPDSGCIACVPDQPFCVDDEIWTCNEDGTTIDHTSTCETGQECLLGQCYDSCELAESTESYFGCRFLSVPTANYYLDPAFDSDFAVVIANGSTDPADVVVRQGGSAVASATVPPQETSAIQLDLVAQLQTPSESTRVVQGAFEITSSVPVAAYQYNPLHFRTEGADGTVHSYTNDASLLLPEHVLTGNYRASTWPTWGYGEFPGESSWTPGFVAITATEDGTLVTITTSANTAAGSIPAMEAGEDTVVSLDRGDVLQLLSEVPDASLITNTCAERGGEQAPNGVADSCLDGELGDLTGSLIQADRPVAVFAGHVCTFIPFDRFACDHLEEMMFPTETWGTATVMTAPHRPGGLADSVAPAMYRVLSASDANLVTFSPDVEVPTSLNAGEHVEFLANGDFVVEGSGRFFVTQTMLGEEALDSNSGDPAMGSGIPTAQWRDEYDFLVPDTYTSNWVNVVAEAGTVVFLDGVEMDSWEAIDETIFEVARIELEAGAHHIESVDDAGFGITSYGYASYTSYLHPGGLNFLR